MLTGRKTPGEFETTLLALLFPGVIPNFPASPLLQVTQDPQTGLLTIGYDYPLIVSAKNESGVTVYSLNPMLLTDFQGIHSFSPDEKALLKEIAADLNAGNVSKAVSDFDGRAGDVLSFSITGGAPGDNAETLFQTVINRDVTSAALTAIATNPHMVGTYELAALEALAYENPSLLTIGLRTAVAAGDRQTAWYDIVAKLDISKSASTEMQRIAEANEFGLYSLGSAPADVAEGLSVHRFLDTRFLGLEKALMADGLDATAVSNFIANSYLGADLNLWNQFGDGVFDYYSYTNVTTAASDTGSVIHFGQDLAIPLEGGAQNQYALVIGGAGNDKLVVAGSLAATLGPGSTILYASGGGDDIINASALVTYETIELEAGAVSELVDMAATGVLKIDDASAFKGKVVGFAPGNVLDLMGIGVATSAVLGANGVLTVSGGSQTANIKLGGAAAYAQEKFLVSKDGSGGTRVIVVPRKASLITFSEYAVGTIVTDQYQKDGVDFSEDSVKNPETGIITYSPCEIYVDGADPYSPALANSANGNFSGPIIGNFVDPNTGAKGTVTQFQFDAGYFDNIGTTKIEWFDKSHNLIGHVTDQTLGYQHFGIQSATPIASFEVLTKGKETSGFTFDNLVVGPVTG